MKRILLLASLFFSASISAQTPWTIIINMETANLTAMAVKNLADLVAAKSSEQVQYAIQVHAYYNVGLRFTVQNNSLILLEQIQLTGDRQQDLVDTLSWGVTSFPADKTMVILWGNGYGILEPTWSDELNDFSVAPDEPTLNKSNLKSRAIMLNGIDKTYMASAQLVAALFLVQKSVMNGNKFSIIGFDMCMGAMLEFAYQLAPFADYIIGSENCEMPDGWDYYALGNTLQNNVDPLSLVSAIGQGFDAYFKTRGGTVYTQSALDTAQSVVVKKLLDQVVNYSSACQKIYGTDFVDTIIKAHQQSPVFCYVSMYTDLYAFIQAWQQELKSLPTNDELELLAMTLKELGLQIQKTIVSNVHGDEIADANGMSIYFPRYVIDPSYQDSTFAQQSLWPILLQMAVDRGNELPPIEMQSGACPI